MSLVPLVSPVSLVSPVGLGGASSPGRVHRHSYLGGDARIQVRYKSVQVSTSQYKSVQVSTSQYKSVQVSASQYKSVQVVSAELLFSCLQFSLRTIIF